MSNAIGDGSIAEATLPFQPDGQTRKRRGHESPSSLSDSPGGQALRACAACESVSGSELRVTDRLAPVISPLANPFWHTLDQTRLPLQCNAVGS
jgi:hypothetical protein